MAARAAAPWLPAAADRAVVERVLARSGVVRAAPPLKSSYLGDLWAAIERAFADAFRAAAAKLDLGPDTGANVLIALLVAAAIALVLIVGALVRRALRARRQGARAAAAGAGTVSFGGGGRPDAEPEERDAAAWWAECERRLALGDVPAAVAALWWWLARSVAGPLADPTWTGRELLARARRNDLRGLVRRLDVVTYGPRRADVEEVRRLAAALAEALA